MATFQVDPPDEFDFGTPESWPQRFQPFQRFRAASDLTNKDQPFQVNALLYTMGPKSGDMHPSLVLTADEKTVDATVTKSLKPLFHMKQQPLLQYIKALALVLMYTSSDLCSY